MFNRGLATKGLIGFAGISAFAGGAYATTKYFLGTPIETLLKQDDYTLLTKVESDKVQWGKRWKEYVAKGNKWSLSSFEANRTKEDDAPEDFKDACIGKSISKVKGNKDPNYKEVVDLCTKSFAISELIGKDKDIVLISTKTTPADNTKWKASWERYFANNQNNPLELTLTGASASSIPNDYGTKCEAKQKIEVKNNKDNNYAIVKEWCTEAKSKQE